MKLSQRKTVVWAVAALFVVLALARIQSFPKQNQQGAVALPGSSDATPLWIRDPNIRRRASPPDSTTLSEWDMAPMDSPTTPVSGYFFINTQGSEFGNANAVFSQVQATNFSGVRSGQGPVALNSNCMLAGNFSAELPKCWGALGEAQTLPSGWSGSARQMFGVVGQVNAFNLRGNGTIATAAAIAGYTVSSTSQTNIQKAVALYGVAPSTGAKRYVLDLMDSSQSKDIITVTANGPGNDTYGEKHKRFGPTCSTIAQAGATCTTLYEWATAFSDRSYTPVCWGVGSSGSPVLSLDGTPQAGSIAVRVMTLSASSSSFAGVYCVAFHDP